MPSTYSPDLRIEIIGNGEQSGTWGTTTNTNLGTIIEDAISGLTTVSVGSVNVVDGRANYALTAFNGAEDQARRAAVSLSTSTSANFNVYVPPVTKLYVMRNTSSYIATVYCSQTIGNTTPAGTGISIPAGKTVLLRSDGTNIIEQLNHVVGSLSTGGSLTVDDSGSVGGSLTVGGDITLRGAVSNREPIFSYSTAYLGFTNAIQITQNATNINVTDDLILLAAPSLVNGTAVMLSSTGTLPGGLDTNPTTTIYYVINTNRTRYYTATGSISGTTLTISAIQAGSIGPSSTVTGTGVASGTTVISQLSATPAGSVGGVGTYSLTGSAQTVASTRISGEFVSGSQTIQLATNRTSTTPVNITSTGSGDLTITPIAMANTPPVGSSTEAIATTAFVNNIVNFQTKTAVKAATTQNITLSGVPANIDGITDLAAGDRVLVKDQFAASPASQTATFTTSSTATATFTNGSAVIIVPATAPASGTPVTFSTSGTLPTGITAGQIYYVSNLSSTTISVSASQTLSPLITVTSAGTGTQTATYLGVISVPSSVTTGTRVEFTNSGGALPTPLVTGQSYYTLRTGTTFSVSYITGGTPITFTGGSGAQTIGVVPAATNGVYIVDASTWTRATDMDSAAEVAAASVPVLKGTNNGGKTFNTSFKSTDTLGTTAMNWDEVITGSAGDNTGTLGGVRITVSGTTLNIFTY
jgi:hypothetical protein